MKQMNLYGSTDIGNKRSANEDAYLICQEFGLAAVADGMGGEAEGARASRLFIETVLYAFSLACDNQSRDIIFFVTESYYQANKKIRDLVKENPFIDGMGCTAELIVFHDGRYVLGHIGDSRTYRLRNEQLKQLTSDHSWVQKAVNDGKIRPEDARQHPAKNYILKAVGTNDDVELDIIQGKYQPKDIYLLCSDGLTDMVEDELIRQILITPYEINLKAEELIEAAKAAGGKDNITVVLAEIN